MTRRDRRAANQSSKASSTLDSASDIPLSHPDTSAPRPAKTLFQLAEERRSQLQPSSQPFSSPNASNTVNVKISEDGSTTRLDTIILEDSPWFDTLLYSITYTGLHFTLAVLCMHQYLDEMDYWKLGSESVFMAFPALVMVVGLFHGAMVPKGLRNAYGKAEEKTKVVVYGSRQMALLVVANVSGVYLIHLCNDRGYYAVMKNAPSVGVLWVWSVVEMGIVGAVLGVVGPVGVARWMGWSLT